MDQRNLRDCLGLFTTGVIIVCAKKKNFFTDNFYVEKIFNHKLFNKNNLGKTFLLKLKALVADEFFGMTINSFSSVSLDPALVLFSVDNKSSNLKFFKKSHHFSLNILSKNQLELSKAFATSKSSNKWQVESHYLGKFGNPIFQNSLGFFECKKQRIIKAGDHHIIIGKVLDFAKLNEQEALVYSKGKYSVL